MASKAIAVVLRGHVSLASMAIMLRTRSPFSHAALLLDNGYVVEASALAGKVITRKFVPAEGWAWDRIYPLDGLGPVAMERIAALALGMVGWGYGWQEIVGDVTGRHMDDPKRVVCFEMVALATQDYIRYRKPANELTGREMVQALRAMRR